MPYGKPYQARENIDTLSEYCSALVRDAPDILYKARNQTNVFDFHLLHY
jgi:hypothetical protein